MSDKTRNNRYLRELVEYLSEKAFLKGLDTNDIETYIKDFAQNYYKFPHSNKIYYFGVKPSSSIDPDFFSFTLNIERKSDFSYNKFYKLFSAYLSSIYRKYTHCIEKRLSHKFICNNQNGVPCRKDYNVNEIFYKYEKLVLIHKNFTATNENTILTPESLKRFFKEILEIELPSEDILKKILTSIYNSNNLHIADTKIYNGFIVSHNDQYISLKDNMINIETPDASYLDEMNNFSLCNPPLYPERISTEPIVFSETDKKLLSLLLNGKQEHLFHISNLFYSAYSVNFILKKPMVFHCINDKMCDYISNLLARLFDMKIDILSDKNMFIYPDDYISQFAASISTKNVALLFRLNKNIFYIDGIKSLAKGKYMTDDCISIRNKLPVIILTTNNKVCGNLQAKLNANIIDLRHLNDDNFSTDLLYHFNLKAIRQAFTLYGLFSSKHKVKLEKWDNKSTYTELFYDRFMEPDEDCVVSKNYLREVFHVFVANEERLKEANNIIIKNDDEMVKSKKYEELRKEMNVDKLNKIVRSISICDYLKSLGFNGGNKKRLYLNSNPVAIIENIKIREKAFHDYLDTGKPLSGYGSTINEQLIADLALVGSIHNSHNIIR